jgi:hypothetical protein
LDYAKHCTVPFGASVQANHETNQTNSNASQTLDVIYLRPVNSMQGGHELYVLNSGREITRARVTQIPVTDVVVKSIELLQRIKVSSHSNLKIERAQSFMMLIGLQEWIMMKTPNKKMTTTKIMTKRTMKILMKIIKDDQYDRIDEDEIEDLNEDAREEDNPNQH